MILEILKNNIINLNLPLFETKIMSRSMIYNLRIITKFLFENKIGIYRLKSSFLKSIDKENDEDINPTYNPNLLQKNILFLSLKNLILCPFISVYILFYFIFKHILVIIFLKLENEK
jgi:hypothetical protein